MTNSIKILQIFWFYEWYKNNLTPIFKVFFCSVSFSQCSLNIHKALKKFHKHTNKQKIKRSCQTKSPKSENLINFNSKVRIFYSIFNLKVWCWSMLNLSWILFFIFHESFPCHSVLTLSNSGLVCVCNCSQRKETLSTFSCM